MNTDEIKVQATVAANAQKVWGIAPNQSVSPAGIFLPMIDCPKTKNDLKVGGRISYRMEVKDGGFGFDSEAIYDEILNFKKDCLHDV